MSKLAHYISRHVNIRIRISNLIGIGKFTAEIWR